MRSLATIARSSLPPSTALLPPGTAAGYFLTIGVNAPDPDYYGSGVPTLMSAEADAIDLAAIMKGRGFHPWAGLAGSLLGRQATAGAVGTALDQMSAHLAPGDTAVICFAGHGCQIPDESGDERKDGADEAWCLFDRPRIDDENLATLVKFRAGTFVYIYSDSCHSATAALADASTAGLVPSARDNIALRTYIERQERPRYRGLDVVTARDLYARHVAEYRGVRLECLPGVRSPVRAAGTICSACQDFQLAGDGDDHGLWTGQILRLLRAGFRGTWRQLHEAVKAIMPPTQIPAIDFVGLPDGLNRPAFRLS